MRSLIKDAENGLFSRFLFYYLNSKSDWHDVFDSGSGIALDDYFKQLGEEFHSLHKLLQPKQPIRVELTSSQMSRFNSYFSAIQTRQLDSYGEFIVASVRRLGLSTFRIILILTALRILETGDLSSPLTCTEPDFRTALTICDVLIVHIDKVFSTLPQVEEPTSVASAPNTRQQTFLDTLPETFDRQTYQKLAATLGIPAPSSDRYIKKWIETGKIEKIEYGRYRKS